MNQEFKTFVQQNVNANEKMVVIKKTGSNSNPRVCSFIKKLICCRIYNLFWWNFIEEKGKFGKFLTPGRKRKYKEMERDEKEKILMILRNKIIIKDKIFD